MGKEPGKKKRSDEKHRKRIRREEGQRSKRKLEASRRGVTG